MVARAWRVRCGSAAMLVDDAMQQYQQLKRLNPLIEAKALAGDELANAPESREHVRTRIWQGG
jgi:hypothetical protein